MVDQILKINSEGDHKAKEKATQQFNRYDRPQQYIWLRQCRLSRTFNGSVSQCGFYTNF